LPTRHVGTLGGRPWQWDRLVSRWSSLLLRGWRWKKPYRWRTRRRHRNPFPARYGPAFPLEHSGAMIDKAPRGGSDKSAISALLLAGQARLVPHLLHFFGKSAPIARDPPSVDHHEGINEF